MEKTLAERFWEKVDKSGGSDACWPWMACTFQNTGYGQFRLSGKSVKAHRVAYALNHGPVPVGMDVLHSCDSPPCCNDTHLFLGTQLENVRDCIAKGRANKARGECHYTYTHPGSRRGERNGNAKLTEDQVREIRRLATEGQSQRKIGRLMGVTQANIGYIVRGETWR